MIFIASLFQISLVHFHMVSQISIFSFNYSKNASINCEIKLVELKVVCFIFAFAHLLSVVAPGRGVGRPTPPLSGEKVVIAVGGIVPPRN